MDEDKYIFDWNVKSPLSPKMVQQNQRLFEPNNQDTSKFDFLADAAQQSSHTQQVEYNTAPILALEGDYDMSDDKNMFPLPKIFQQPHEKPSINTVFSEYCPQKASKNLQQQDYRQSENIPNFLERSQSNNFLQGSTAPPIQPSIDYQKLAEEILRTKSLAESAAILGRLISANPISAVNLLIGATDKNKQPPVRKERTPSPPVLKLDPSAMIVKKKTRLEKNRNSTIDLQTNSKILSDCLSQCASPKQRKRSNSSFSKFSEPCRQLSGFSDSQSERSNNSSKVINKKTPFKRHTTAFAQQQGYELSDATSSEEGEAPSDMKDDNLYGNEGALNSRDRQERVRRYLRKKYSRHLTRKYTYTKHRKVANKRLRIKGRFITEQVARQMLDLDEAKSFSTEVIQIMLIKKEDTNNE